MLLALGVACGRSRATQPGSGAADGGAAGLGGAAGAAAGAEAAGGFAVGGAPVAGEEGGDAGVAGVAGVRGSVHVSLVSLPGSPRFDGAYLRVTVAAPGSRDGCSTTRVGDCELRACAEQAEPVDAGRISLVSAPSGYHVSIDPTDGLYLPTVETGIYPAEGDPVLAAAVGHTVPQFYVDGTLPFGLVVASEVASTSGLVTVPRSEAFVLRWDESAEDVRVELEAADLDTQVHCGADAALGRLTIPQSVLDALEPGTPLVVTTATAVTESFGEYDVTLRTAVGVYDESDVRLDFTLE